MDKTERRQQLLQHARDVFSRKGLHATNVEDIVQAAGVARGTFYLYFADKRAIFEEIVDRFLAKIAMAILRVDVGDTNRTVHDQIRENLTRLIAVLLEDRATSKILLSHSLGIDPSFDRKFLSFYDELSRLLEDSLREGQELKIVDKRIRAEGLAPMILGALKESLLQAVSRGGNDVAQTLENELFSFFRHGFLNAG